MLLFAWSPHVAQSKAGAALCDVRLRCGHDAGDALHPAPSAARAAEAAAIGQAVGSTPQGCKAPARPRLCAHAAAAALLQRRAAPQYRALLGSLLACRGSAAATAGGGEASLLPHHRAQEAQKAQEAQEAQEAQKKAAKEAGYSSVPEWKVHPAITAE